MFIHLESIYSAPKLLFEPSKNQPTKQQSPETQIQLSSIQNTLRSIVLRQ